MSSFFRGLKHVALRRAMPWGRATGVTMTVTLALALIHGSATAMVSMSPELKKDLRSHGTYEVVRDRLIRARASEYFVNAPKADVPERVPGKMSVWNALFILVDFSDKPATGNYDQPQWESLLLSEGTHATGSLKDFYLENSYGDFIIQGEVAGWYRMPQPLSYYCNNDGVPDTADDHGFGPGPNNARQLYIDAVAAADADVDFSQYTNGGTGVRAVFIIHAGPGAETTGDASDIWSHFSSGVAPTNDGVNCTSYTFQPELQGGGQATMGVFAHEFGHSQGGLPDLYDIDDSSSGLGRWSAMAAGSWNNGGRSPAHFDGWSKRAMGLVDYTNVTVDTMGWTLAPATSTPSVLRVQTPSHAPGEFLVVENRRRTGFDTFLPSEGLLVYHVDANQNGNNLETCGPGPSHPKVRLIQADGLCDLENSVGFGDSGDPYPGSTGNTVLGTMTVPDARTYSGDKSGVRLSNIANVGSDVQFDVELSEIVSVRVPLDVSTLELALSLLGDGDNILLRSNEVSSGHFVLGRGVKVEGGYDPTYTTQDPGAPSSIVDLGSSSPLFRIINATGTVHLDNVSLSGGKGYRDFEPEAWLGGTIYAEDSNLMLTRVNMSGGQAGPNDTLPSYGGAVAVVGGTLHVEDCALQSNTAKEGGAVYALGADVNVVGCTFGATSLALPIPAITQRGGALLVLGGSLSVQNTLFTERVGAHAGGAVYVDAAPVQLHDSTFNACDASADGGAWHQTAGSIVASGNTFVGNTSGGSGAGARLDGALVDWRGGVFEGNDAAVGGGGLNLNAPQAGSRVGSVVFVQNHAQVVGGGATVTGGDITLEHLVFYGNTADVVGGAAQVATAQAVVRNNIFQENSNALLFSSGVPTALDWNVYWNNTGSDVSGAAMGANSVDADPRFVDVATGDFHLGAQSPAIDGGDPAAAADFDGSAPDAGVFGGTDDDGDRPGRVMGVQGSAQANDDLVSWTLPSQGTPTVSAHVFGLLDESISNATFLAAVAAPMTSWLHVSPTPGLSYRVQAVDANGRAGSYGQESVASDVPAYGRRLNVGQPFPNPFNPRTSIRYELDRTSAVRAAVFDMRGRQVRELFQGVVAAGAHELVWDGADTGGSAVASGAYLLRIEAAGAVASRPLILLK